ncbi:ATP-binding cassette domain-containing protein [bacterium]|nr:ATP-binding cassette domain-containing protein [bacterium]
MISFRHVTKIYSRKRNFSKDGQFIVALDDISFDIKEKEFVSIVGKSGAGKTTLLKLLIREEKPTRGKIFFENRDISQIPPSELPKFRRKIGVIFQDYKLLPSRTVYENVAYVLEVMGAPEWKIAKEVPEVLEIVGLKERADSFSEELSGGEKQRVAIARALIHRPKVIIADEPTGNLDPYHTKDIIDLLCKIYELGTTVILATHHKTIINKLGKRVITLEEGRLIRDEEKGRFII